MIVTMGELRCGHPVLPGLQSNGSFAAGVMQGSTGCVQNEEVTRVRVINTRITNYSRQGED